MVMRRCSRLVPHLVVKNAANAIEFYKKAFGAVEVARLPEGSRLRLAELRIGDATLFLQDESADSRSDPVADRPAAASTVTLHIDVASCDAALDRAEAAGATVVMPASNTVWGDRFGKIADPFGHIWSFANPLPAAHTAAAHHAPGQARCG